MISSTQLRAQADLTQLMISDLHSQVRDQWSQVEDIFAATSGEGFAAAETRTQDLVHRWDNTALLAKVESTLRFTALAAATLERMLDHARIDSSPLVSLLVKDIAMMGRALDAACAARIRQLSALCTAPLSDVYTPTLGHFSSLSAREIHVIAASTASPRTLAILEEYPDATLLEASADHMVLAFGDIDSATHITTVVAGVGSSSTWEDYTQRAKILADATGPTIMWLGYNAPENLVAGTTTEPARAGAKALTEFQHALRERTDAHLTVLGHSYGSVVASHANLAADTVILAGSPGVAPIVTDNPNAKVIAVLSSDDLISLTGTNSVAIHGHDPAASTSPYIQWRIPGDHSAYFTSPEFHELMKTRP